MKSLTLELHLPLQRNKSAPSFAFMFISENDTENMNRNVHDMSGVCYLY